MLYIGRKLSFIFWEVYRIWVFSLWNESLNHLRVPTRSQSKMVMRAKWKKTSITTYCYFFPLSFSFSLSRGLFHWPVKLNWKGVNSLPSYCKERKLQGNRCQKELVHISELFWNWNLSLGNKSYTFLIAQQTHFVCSGQHKCILF